MIYKILLIATAAASVVGFKLSRYYAEEAREATQTLEPSRLKLEDAKKKEEISFKDLQMYKKREMLEKRKENLKREIDSLERDIDCLNIEIKDIEATQKGDISSQEREIPLLEIEMDDENMNRVITATMNLIRPEGSTREALAELFDETVFVLDGHMSLNIDDLYEEAQMLNQRYAKRACMFKGAGVNKTLGRLCIILGYVHLEPRVKDPYIENETGYVVIVYQFSDSGRVNARGMDYMSLDDKDYVNSLLPEDYKMFSYKGNDYDKFSYKGAEEVKFEEK